MRLMTTGRIFLIAVASGVLLTGSVLLMGAGERIKKTGEPREDWRPLFAGKTFDGWKKLKGGGWTIRDGVLSAQPVSDGTQGDIITAETFGNFELSLEFRIHENTNSGIKYLVTNNYPGYEGSYLGLEYQILDEVNFVYPERGELRTTASLYDLIPSQKAGAVPEGSWMKARIVVEGNHVEHWLNGMRVVRYERGSPSFLGLVAGSKYRNFKAFGEAPAGHILLQNEGSPVDFRNIKIKTK